MAAGEQDALGLPHPRAYGNFPRVIARYVRERGVLTLPEAIRKMTSWLATRMRLADRGLVREGLWADVVVFDYDTIRDRATYEQPTLSPEGIDWVLVNGGVVIDHGRHSGARPGRVLYGPGRRIAQTETAAARPLLTVPIDATVRQPPMPFQAEGKSHLAYELTITNLGADDCVIDRVAIFASGAKSGSGKELASYDNQALIDAVARPGLGALRGERKLTIGAGQRAVVYLWLSVPRLDVIPPALEHEITVKLGEAQQVASTRTARVAIAGKTRTIGPPLRGANWVAANGPSNTSGHRRTIIPIDGAARVPQRFAIDWLQLAPDGRSFEGDPKDNRNYRAYGEEAIAVADGVVSAVKDGIPENIPGPTSRAVPITLDTIGGNYVIVDIGGGVFAFYAHLQPGTLTVKAGDKVRRGQVVGLVGNSGNSTEPHLHFHLSDANSPLGGVGLPYTYTGFDIEGKMGVPQGGSWPAWTPLAEPEPRAAELPMQNTIVRFRDR